MLDPDRPLPLTAYTFFSFAICTRANMSPPNPVEHGSNTDNAAAIAIDASIAFVPLWFWRMFSPMIDARFYKILNIPMHV